MGEGGFAAVDEAEFALHLEFFDRDADESEGAKFTLDGEGGHEGDAVALLDEAADGLERREFDVDAKRCFIALEGFEDLGALGRWDVVGDEVLVTELANGDGAGLGETVARVDDEGEFVAIDDDGFERGILWAEADDADFDGVGEDLVGNTAGERALHGDLDAGVGAAELVEDGQQREAGVLVGGEGEAAAVEGAEFAEGIGGFGAEVEKFLGVVAQDFTGVGEGPVAGGSLEEGFAQFGFELGDGLADGGLGAAEAGGGAGEAALLRDGEEGF